MTVPTQIRITHKQPEIALKQIPFTIYLIIHRGSSPKSSELNHHPINRRIIPAPPDRQSTENAGSFEAD